MYWRIGLVMVNDSGKMKRQDETCLQVIRELVEEELIGEIVEERAVPKQLNDIAAALIEITDYYHAHLIFTSGGLRMDPNDVAPEAALKVMDRLAPGFSEFMRTAQLTKDPSAMLNRGVSGMRGRTLIINLPDTPEGVYTCLHGILPYLPAALVELNRGNHDDT
ncbi:MAG: molybdenum cofactor biosynthesis protein [Paenibacillus sp. RIFOXYA1_FULL_44_5]|nr:MAG: molybdenum cofactor biosynthesis protein [Paenibacillus sp. RIFOXYA1_FULL_44_5]